MPADLPDVAEAGDGRTGLRFWNIVGRVRFRLTHPDTADQRIDLWKFEPGQAQIEVKIKLGQILEFDAQQLPVPADSLRQPVVGNDIGANIGLAHVAEPQGRDLGQAKTFRGIDPAVSGMIPPPSSTRTGLVKPKRVIDAAICSICFLECVRGLLARGRRSAMGR